MARIIVHKGKKKVVVKVQGALDREDLIFAILEDGVSLGIPPKNKRHAWRWPNNPSTATASKADPAWQTTTIKNTDPTPWLSWTTSSPS